MSALIDTPEFSAAKDALQKAVRAFEDARLDVLIQLRAFAEAVRRLGMVHEDAHNMLDACLKAEIFELPAKRGQA